MEKHVDPNIANLDGNDENDVPRGSDSPHAGQHLKSIFEDDIRLLFAHRVRHRTRVYRGTLAGPDTLSDVKLINTVFDFEVAPKSCGEGASATAAAEQHTVETSCSRQWKRIQAFSIERDKQLEVPPSLRQEMVEGESVEDRKARLQRVMEERQMIVKRTRALRALLDVFFQFLALSTCDPENLYECRRAVERVHQTLVFLRAEMFVSLLEIDDGKDNSWRGEFIDEATQVHFPWSSGFERVTDSSVFNIDDDYRNIRVKVEAYGGTLWAKMHPQAEAKETFSTARSRSTDPTPNTTANCDRRERRFHQVLSTLQRETLLRAILIVDKPIKEWHWTLYSLAPRTDPVLRMLFLSHAALPSDPADARLAVCRTCELWENAVPTGAFYEPDPESDGNFFRMLLPGGKLSSKRAERNIEAQRATVRRLLQRTLPPDDEFSCSRDARLSRCAEWRDFLLLRESASTEKAPVNWNNKDMARFQSWIGCSASSSSTKEADDVKSTSQLLLDFTAEWTPSMDQMALPKPEAVVSNVLIYSIPFPDAIGPNSICKSFKTFYEEALAISVVNALHNKGKNKVHPAQRIYKVAEHYRGVERMILMQRLRMGLGARVNYNVIRIIISFVHRNVKRGSGDSFRVPEGLEDKYKAEGFA